MKKAKSKTERIPSSSILETLNAPQKALHEEIAAAWNELCVQQSSLGRKLRKMHDTFKGNGTVKAGGPGSRWTKYLSAVGIPKSTAKDYMNLAKERSEAGIPEQAERHLASVGIPLDKAKVSDALLTSELREKVMAIKSPEQAEALKPRILEIAQTAHRSNGDKPRDTPELDKGKAVQAAIHYLDRFKGETLQAKFAEFCAELSSILETSEQEEDF
jgi:hypothetical protein